MTISKLLQHHGHTQAAADKLESEYLAEREANWAAERNARRTAKLEARRAEQLEAELVRGMGRALRPFPSAQFSAADTEWEFRYPRAGVRRRPDGRFHLRIWLNSTEFDPIQGGPQETLLEALNLGAMICHYAREAAL